MCKLAQTRKITRARTQMAFELPMTGQGVIVFNQTSDIEDCIFQILNKDATDGINIEFTRTHVIVREIKSMRPCLDPTNISGLTIHEGAYYWFSIDSQNQRFYAGVGEARIETAIYSYKYPAVDKTEYENTKAFLESLQYVYYSQPIEKMRIIKDPITQTIPLKVKNTNELTMDDIAASRYMPIANLPPVCRKLYDCISGEKFVLDTPDFPDFTQAIEYSIRTPGKWCHQKLIDKSREFNPDKPNLLETYLRITLGQNNGESPGIPYVMEIWPVGHYSPIHSHADANAIIRVLNGEIHVNLFPFLCGEKDGVAPFGYATFKKDEITWITPTLNVTHQLKNLDTNSYTCITIQCYMYDAKSNSHYDYFDYLDDNGTIQKYEPDSDMDFLSFKEKIREEWNDIQSKKQIPKSKKPKSSRKFLRSCVYTE